MKKVVFDSNVWRQVASPRKYRKDPGNADYTAIHQACSERRVSGFIAETVFSLEQIARHERLKWLQEKLKKAGGITPGTWDVVRDHLNDAMGIGIQVLRVNRIGTEKSALLSKEMFLDVDEDDFDRVGESFGEVAGYIESLGAGMAGIRKYGRAPNTSMHWLKNIALVGEGERQKNEVADAVAEWADGDLVATAIAHQVDAICTNDIAIGASSLGIHSIFSLDNRNAITNKYPIRFVSPAELAREM